MIYKDLGNNALCMTNKALRAVIHDIREIADGIEMARACIHSEMREFPDDPEMLKEAIEEDESSLKGYVHMLLDVLTEIIEIMDFNKSIYCDE